MDMDTATPTGEQDRVPDIAPDGDVILIVGEENVRLRVYSQCLRSVAKVSGAMFGRDWSERQSLFMPLPEEVRLPEDNADAMRTICCVLHARNDLLSKHLTATEILQAAVAVDKYDLKSALEHAGSVWLMPEPFKGILDRARFLAAAFLFNNAEAFLAHSRYLILGYTESYSALFKDEIISQVLPSEMFCT
jgi:hypothetical protein